MPYAQNMFGSHGVRYTTSWVETIGSRNAAFIGRLEVHFSHPERREKQDGEPEFRRVSKITSQLSGMCSLAYHNLRPRLREPWLEGSSGDEGSLVGAGRHQKLVLAYQGV